MSSIISLEASGVDFYDKEGNKKIFCNFADAGVNYIRYVWNDPFNAEGKGYGGGNCNDTAVQIGKEQPYME